MAMNFSCLQLRNQLKKLGDYEYHLKKDVINGVTRGFTGFVVNPVNGSTVFVISGDNRLPGFGGVIRYADDIRDFHGYRNRPQRVGVTASTLAREIAELLTEPVNSSPKSKDVRG